MEWDNLANRENMHKLLIPKLAFWRLQECLFCSWPVTPITVTSLKLFPVNFVFITEYVALVSTRKSIGLFPTVSCSWGFCGEMVIGWEVSNGTPGSPHSSSASFLRFNNSAWILISIFPFAIWSLILPVTLLLTIGTLINAY